MPSSDWVQLILFRIRVWIKRPPLVPLSAPQSETYHCGLHLHQFSPKNDLIQCPVCGHTRHSAGTTLRGGTGWAVINCSCCKNKPRSNKWQCSCHGLWHQCYVHSQLLPHLEETRKRRQAYVAKMRYRFKQKHANMCMLVGHIRADRNEQKFSKSGQRRRR